MNKLLDYKALFDDYASYHTTKGNRDSHSIGIPLIVFAVVKWTQFGSVIPAAALALPLYFYWDRRVGFIMTGFLAACAVAATAVPGWVAWAAFIVGWAFQIYGHEVHEKNKPALLDNLTHALIGPAFIAHKLAGLSRR